MSSHAITSILAAKKWDNYPFDLRFSSKVRFAKTDTGQSEFSHNNVKGPGIYFVSFKGTVIYVGLHKGDNVVDKALLRLLNRLTLRGSQTGFGRRKPDDVISSLPETLKPYVSYMASQWPEDKPFKDTGAVATQTDIEFVKAHWESDFANASEHSILNNFEFSYYQVCFDSNDTGNSEAFLSAVEKAVLSQFSFAAMRDNSQNINHQGALNSKTLTQQINPMINELSQRSKCGLTLALHLHQPNVNH